jgi:hypothetical protein
VKAEIRRKGEDVVVFILFSSPILVIEVRTASTKPHQTPESLQGAEIRRKIRFRGCARGPHRVFGLSR